MGKVFDQITTEIQEWIKKQRMFFVSTAPLSKDGHINSSPKGLDSFLILDQNSVAYLDLTGSGAETIAHLKENGRIVVMFCEFEGAPNIVRLYGKGIVHQIGSESFESWKNQFPESPSARSVIEIKVSRVSSSCGFGVPKYEYQEQRETLNKWGTKRNSSELREYHKQKNAKSIDGLNAMEF